MAQIRNTDIAPSNTPQSSARVQLFPKNGGDAIRSGVDASAVWLLDVPDGPYHAVESVGQFAFEYDLYVPPLEGPFTIDQLLAKRPDAAANWAGDSAEWNGLDAVTLTPTEQTLDVDSVGSWTWPAGRCMSGAAIIDGLIFFAGAPTNINAITPNGATSLVSIYDPGSQTIRHLQIPTSKGVHAVTSPSNPLIGGSDNVNVEAVAVGGDIWACVLSSCPYPIGGTQWSAAAYGVFPSIAVLRKIGGVWQVDPSKSMTADDLHASGAKGAASFPNNTNAFGETFAQNLGLAKLAVTPISNRLATMQYFQDEPNTGFRGGRLIVIDPGTKTVLAHYEPPYVGDSYSQDGQTLHTLSPREIAFDPTSTAGHERFFVIYDAFQSVGGFEVNYFQIFEYDDGAGAIAPLSYPLPNDFTNISHWTNGAWDSTGGLLLCRRKGLVQKGLAYFPRLDGYIKPVQFPYAWTGSIALNKVIGPDTTADFAASLDSGSFSFNRSKFDPTTKCFIHPAAGDLAAVTPINVDGDPHAPVLTVLPYVNPDFQTFLKPLQSPGVGNWQDPGIDVASRVIAMPMTTFDNTTDNPELLPQWCFSSDLDRIAARPTWGRKATLTQINKTSFVAVLPADWQEKDVMFIFVPLNIGSDPATNPINITAGWTKVFDVRNGGVGLRYALFYRAMVAGDVAPTLSWTGASNYAEATFYLRGVDTASPIDVWAQILGPGSGGQMFDARPSVTPGVPGCTIIGLYGAQGQVSGVQAFGEVTPGEIVRAAIVGNGLGSGPSVVVTQEEQQAGTSPTRQRQCQFSAAGLQAGFTIAVRPAPTPANPPAVSSVGLVPSTVAHGGTSVCTVTLASAAPAQGVVATVTPSNSKATVPYTCFIAPGATSGTVTVNAITAGTVNIVAKTVGASQQATLTIT